MLIPRGPADARLMIVTECVTYRDLQSNTILNDREFDRMLEDAGIDRNQTFVTAFIRGQITGQNFDFQVAQSQKARTPDHVEFKNRYVKRGVIPYVQQLERDIDLVKPRVILALGNGALFALTGKWGIKSWRSSILDYTTPAGHQCKVIATYPPGLVMAMWKERNSVVFDMRKAHKLAMQDTPIEAPKYNFIIEPGFGVTCKILDGLLSRANEGPLKLANDIETRGGHIACVGLAWSKTDAICIPFLRATLDPQRINYWPEHEEAFIQYKLYKLLTHPNVENIGQNFIYDAQYYWRHLLYVPNFKRDTMLAQHTMFSNMPKGLDVLSALHCTYHVYWKDESKNWDPKLGERQLWSYNCVDCVRTYEIDDSQQSAIREWSVTWPQLPSIHDFQQSLFWPVLASMNRGLRVNNNSKARLSLELAEAIKTRVDWITEVLGHPLNIKSPLQMKDLFYRVLAQKEIKSRKTHAVTCDDAALEKISSREPLLLPLCDKIRELRSLGVFRSTFLEAPVDTDERMRCSFNIGGTETFRFSSSENAFNSGMNLQNIPKGDEETDLPNIRKLFLADEGMEFFDVDLDSADLRIVVWESDCLEMKQMFAEGLKPYVEIAKEYYRDPTITKDHSSYKLFKALCHGTNYLGTASGLASRIGLLSVEIERIQKWYYGKFPQIKTWQEDLCQRLRANGFVENVFGYRIYYFDRMEGTIFNQAVAAVPQSTVACLINRGYKAIHDSAPEVQILLQVHDSLAGQYPIAQRDTAVKKIIDKCSIPLPYSSGELIIPVGIKTSTVSWGDCG